MLVASKDELTWMGRTFRRGEALVPQPEGDKRRLLVNGRFVNEVDPDHPAVLAAASKRSAGSADPKES